jgi:hypothetical protein
MTPLESLTIAPAAVAGPLLVVNLTVNLTHDDDAAVCHTGSRPAGGLLGSRTVSCSLAVVVERRQPGPHICRDRPAPNSLTVSE